MSRMGCMWRFYAMWGIFLLCPSVLLLGNIVNLIFSTNNWIANKDGILNVWFVKRGWFWTSLIAWWCILKYKSYEMKILRKHFKRYLLFILWWYIYTQRLWIRIEPIMDLIFVFTGGRCDFKVFNEEMNLNPDFHDSEQRRSRSLRRLLAWFQNRNSRNKFLNDQTLYWLKCRIDMVDCERLSTSGQLINEFILNSISQNHNIRSSSNCARLGGHWIGGHDPSGHIFLLSLMLLFLMEEFVLLWEIFIPILKKSTVRYRGQFLNYLKELLKVGLFLELFNCYRDDFNWIKTIINLPIKCLKVLFKIVALLSVFVVWENPIVLLIILILTWLWSMFITSMLFHSFWEQCTGLLSAYAIVMVMKGVL